MLRGTLLDLALNIPQMIGSLAVYKIALKWRSFSLFAVTYMLFFAVIYALEANALIDGATKMALFSMWVVVSSFFCEEPASKGFVYNCALLLTGILNDLIVAFIITVVLRVGLGATYDNFTYFLITKALCLVVYTGLFYGFHLLWTRHMRIRYTMPNSFLILALSQSVSFIIVLSQSLQTETSVSFVILITVCIGTCVIGDYLILRYIKRLENQHLLEEENRVMHIQLQAQETHYNSLISSIEQMSLLRHDINNQLQTIFSLIEKGDTAHAQSMAATLQQRLNCASVHNFCDNRVVDAILTEKLRRCKKLGIVLDASVRISQDAPVDSVDLCSLFCNVLDNAISASENLPEEQRRITLRAAQAEDWLTLTAENNFAPDTPRTPGDASVPFREHGLGLRIIGDISEKYQGRTVTAQSHGVFKVTVSLSLQAREAALETVNA